MRNNKETWKRRRRDICQVGMTRQFFVFFCLLPSPPHSLPSHCFHCCRLLLWLPPRSASHPILHLWRQSRRAIGTERTMEGEKGESALSLPRPPPCLLLVLPSTGSICGLCNFLLLLHPILHAGATLGVTLAPPACEGEGEERERSLAATIYLCRAQGGRGNGQHLISSPPLPLSSIHRGLFQEEEDQKEGRKEGRRKRMERRKKRRKKWRRRHDCGKRSGRRKREGKKFKWREGGKWVIG